MGFHLISIDENELRKPVADREEFISTLGSAVLLACLEPETETITIRPPNPKTNEPDGEPILTIRHVAEVDEGEINLWVWASDEGVAIADLAADELETLRKIVASRQSAVSQSVS